MKLHEEWGYRLVRAHGGKLDREGAFFPACSAATQWFTARGHGGGRNAGGFGRVTVRDSVPSPWKMRSVTGAMSVSQWLMMPASSVRVTPEPATAGATRLGHLNRTSPLQSVH